MGIDRHCTRERPHNRVTVAIPTYGRDQVLVDTIERVLALDPRASEVLVVDQTPEHAPATRSRLESWSVTRQIRLLKQSRPSIPAAMNRALCEAGCPLVLFLDDDVLPAHDLVGQHVAAHLESAVVAVAGQVLQPGQNPRDVPLPSPQQGLNGGLNFPFFSTRSADVHNVMAGNLSVKREKALAIGGFDERFLGAAYRFETDFARRLIQAGGRVRYWPAASIRHLRAESGGTRIAGSHLTSMDPRHGVGDYYFAIRHGNPWETAVYSARRMMREVRTRFHLTHPWYIPVKLLGECRALAWAIQLARGAAREARTKRCD